MNYKFKLYSNFTPTGDQPEAIASLTKGLQKNEPEQTLLGVTGSGKTFTIAHVIEHIQRPTLVISHNKTLAAQLYQEFRDFFPDNAVSYFVSYYDYYQPESYIPQTDTYIEKVTQINEQIDMLRLSATTNLLTRPDTIVIASVSSIYNIGSPKEYGQFVLELQVGMTISLQTIKTRLVQLQYERNDWDFTRGVFRLRGETIDLFLAYEDHPIRMTVNNTILTEISYFNPLTGETTEKLHASVIYPAKHFMTDPSTYTSVCTQIEKDLVKQITLLKSQGKLVEAQRLEARVTNDIDMIKEVGYVNGIENYSRYFDGRRPGSAPNTLLDYFKENCRMFHPDDPNGWLLVIDESHITIPQIRGMYNGDRSRKQTLIDYGFRLPSALDNRPLTFDEFIRRMGKTIYVSATPNEWEMKRSSQIVEQLVRPTGLVDPLITVRNTDAQIPDLLKEIEKRAQNKERVLVTTITKKMAEDLTGYLKERGIRVEYIHADVETLDRTTILTDLRKGAFDCIVGVNLLREGLDLPEVSLVVILDADKEGFLRNKTSLIQTMGRAARHIKGEVILYADVMTKSIHEAIQEVTRRRNIQLIYNRKHHITPASIDKPIRNPLVQYKKDLDEHIKDTVFSEEFLESLTPHDKKGIIKKLQTEMKEAAKNYYFEEAARIRDLIKTLTTS